MGFQHPGVPAADTEVQQVLRQIRTTADTRSAHTCVFAVQANNLLGVQQWWLLGV